MVFVNVGINLMNQNKAKDAMPFFEKAIARFPDSPDAYYYRGMANCRSGRAIRPDNQAEGDKLLAAGKADLRSSSRWRRRRPRRRWRRRCSRA